MKKHNKSKCELCAIKGYSPEICKVHHRHMAQGKASESCPVNTTRWSPAKMAAAGVGTGTAVALGGVMLLPASALKSFLGHYLLVKTGIGIGALGAGFGFMGKEKGAEAEASRGRWRLYYPSGGRRARSGKEGGVGKGAGEPAGSTPPRRGGDMVLLKGGKQAGPGRKGGASAKPSTKAETDIGAGRKKVKRA